MFMLLCKSLTLPLEIYDERDATNKYNVILSLQLEDTSLGYGLSRRDLLQTSSRGGNDVAWMNSRVSKTLTM